MTHSNIFVSTAWLVERLEQPEIVVLDGSYYLSTMKRDPGAEYLAGHIPGAIRFDIDVVKDMSSPLPHMLPSAAEFAAKVGAMGISDDMTIVVYDGLGLFSAPRVRWTFRTFGAKNVFIVEGGYPKWLAEGRVTESGPARPRPPATFSAVFEASAVASMADVKAALAGHTAQVVDARPAGRFSGADPEPRPGLSSGHMPGSVNLPFASMIADGQLKDETAIMAAIAAAGIDLDQPIITTCGSGVSAAILSTAMEMLGRPSRALYDGSWSEWASTSGAPIAKV